MQTAEKIRVLVTGAGTASAVSVIKALKDQEYIPLEIIAADPDPLAPGLHLADEKIIIPGLEDSAFDEKISALLKEHGIRVLIPTYSKEIEFFCRNQLLLEKCDVKFMFHPIDTLEICNDKRKFSEFCNTHQIRAPQVYHKPSTVDSFPVLVKPVRSSSSKGILLIGSGDELNHYAKKNTNYLIQDFVEGQEFTIDVLTDTNGQPIVISPRLRISTKAGQSVKGKTVADENLNSLVSEICRCLPFRGPLNIQVIKCKDKYYVIEINPRFAAGGLELTRAAGPNIPLLVVKMILGQVISSDECRVKPGVTMTRYWQEIFIE